MYSVTNDIRFIVTIPKKIDAFDSVADLVKCTDAAVFNLQESLMPPDHPDLDPAAYAKRAIPLVEVLIYLWHGKEPEHGTPAKAITDTLNTLLDAQKTGEERRALLTHMKEKFHSELRHPTVPTMRGDGRLVYNGKLREEYEDFRKKMKSALASCLSKLRKVEAGEAVNHELNNQDGSAFAFPMIYPTLDEISNNWPPENFKLPPLQEIVVSKIENKPVDEVKVTPKKKHQVYDKTTLIDWAQHLEHVFLIKQSSSVETLINGVAASLHTLDRKDRKELLEKIHQAQARRGIFGWNNTTSYNDWKKEDKAMYKRFKDMKELLRK